jgi:outer membrane protein assembly factor BamE
MHSSQTITRSLLLSLSLGVLSGCSWVGEKYDALREIELPGLPGVYKVDVHQGNILEQEQIDQLKPGMSTRQVRFLLGSPLITDVFHQNRWDYFHRVKIGNGEITQKRMSLFFESDQLVRIEGDTIPQPNAQAEVTVGTPISETP